jgi:hypothetical protein
MAHERDGESAKFQQEARAGQSSSNSGPAGRTEGTFEPAYGKEDPFLGADAHVVSGEERRVQVDDDMRDSPGMVLDVGRNPQGGGQGGDDLVRSHGGAEDESVRSADESRKDA